MAGGGLYNPPEGVTTFAALTDTVVVRKSADETVNNSAVLQDDDELLFAVGANEIWFFMILLRYTREVGGGNKIRYKCTIPSGTLRKYPQHYNDGLTSFDGTAQADATQGVEDRYSTLFYIYVGGAPGGNVQLQWCQAIAEGFDHIVKENSLIIAHRLA